MKSLFENLNGKIAQSEKYWPYIIGTIFILEVIHYSLLKQWLPGRASMIITIFIVIITFYYVKEIYAHLCSKYNNSLIERDHVLHQMFDSIKDRMNEIDEKTTKMNANYFSEIIASIHEQLNLQTTQLNNKVQEVGLTTQKIVCDNYKGLTDQINDHSKGLEKQLAEQGISASESFVVLSANLSSMNQGAKELIENHFATVNDVLAIQQHQILEQVNHTSEIVSAQSATDITKLMEKLNQESDEQGHRLADYFEQTWLKTIDWVSEATNEIRLTLAESTAKLTDRIQTGHDNYVHVVREKSVTDRAAFGALDEQITRMDEHARNYINNGVDRLQNTLDTQHHVMLETVSEVSEKIEERSVLNTANILEKLTNDEQEQRQYIAESLDQVLFKTVEEIKHRAEQVQSSMLDSEGILIAAIRSGANLQSETIEEFKKGFEDNLVQVREQAANEGLRIVDSIQTVTKERSSELSDKLDYISNRNIEELQSTKLIVIGQMDKIPELTNKLQNHVSDTQAEILSTLQKWIISGKQDVAATLENKKSIIDARLDEVYKQLSSSIREVNDRIKQKSEDITTAQKETLTQLRHVGLQLTHLKALDLILKNNIGSNEAAATSSANSTAQDSNKSPSRKEEIRDDENGFVLLNTYRNNLLRISEVRQHGKKIYVTDYNDKGIMNSSKTFNEAGDMTTHLLYYDSGVVKERNEIGVRNGRKGYITTRFNEYGNKI